MTDMPWTETQVLILTAAAGEGLTSTQIVEILGPPCTRMAVVGKCRRMGIELKATKGEGMRRAWRSEARPRQAPTETAPPAPEEPGPVMLPVALTEMPPPPAQDPFVLVERPRMVLDGGCRWPIGDPQDRNFHFCDAPRLPKKSYCADHMVESRSGQRPWDPMAGGPPRGRPAAWR